MVDKDNAENKKTLSILKNRFEKETNDLCRYALLNLLNTVDFQLDTWIKMKKDGRMYQGAIKRWITKARSLCLDIV